MCHVLIIEDEPLVAMMIEDVLLQHGATSTAIAATQDEAVAAAEEQAPDFISSDVSLLEGTGPLAVVTIRERLGPIPTLFLTATPSACRPRAPGDPVLSKPFSPHLVAEAFRALVPRGS